MPKMPTDPPAFAWPYVRRIERLTGATVDPLSVWQAWREIEEAPTSSLHQRIRAAQMVVARTVSAGATQEAHGLEAALCREEIAQRRNGKRPDHLAKGWDDGENLRDVCADIKARISVREFVERELGYTVAHNGKTQCPVHDDTTPSFYCYPDGGHCYACGWHNDVIALAQHVWRYDKPIQAIERLRQW